MTEEGRPRDRGVAEVLRLARVKREGRKGRTESRGKERERETAARPRDASTS